MNRYYFYLILLNMLINVFMHVPSILIRERFEGAVLAIPIATFIGTALILGFTWSINKFTGLGIEEILEQTPKWFFYSFLGFFAIMWFTAGAIALLAFNNVTIRFVNPNISGVNMITAFAIFLILLLGRLKSDKMLYTLEIVLILNVPLIFMIVVQAYTNKYLTIDSILEVLTHFDQIPSWSAISAATFIFTGYTNLIIFNRVFKHKIKLKSLWFIPILGFINLITSVFIPIGMWGADGVGDLTFPWISTADALSIEYGPIERLITLFILLYVSISLISVAIHWHVAFEIIKVMIKVKKIKSEKKKLIIEWVILGLFGIGVLILEENLREFHIYNFAEVWLDVRFPAEILLVIVMLFLARRKKNEQKS